MRILKNIFAMLLVPASMAFMYSCAMVLLDLRQVYSPGFTVPIALGERTFNPLASHFDSFAMSSYILGFVIVGLLMSQEESIRRGASLHVSIVRIVIAAIAFLANAFIFPALGLAQLWACELSAGGWFLLVMIEITQFRFRGRFVRPGSGFLGN